MDSGLGLIDRAAERWLKNGVQIVEGPETPFSSTSRGRIYENVALGPEEGYKGGNLEIYDGQNQKGVSFSAKTIGLANGTDLERRVLDRIAQELQKLEGASGRTVGGFDNNGDPAEIRANSTKLQVTMIGIPENQAHLLKSTTFRAALLRYRQTYQTWVSVVPIRNWSVRWWKK